MTVSEVLELVAALLLVAAAGLLAGLLLPAFSWPAGLAVAGVLLFVVSMAIERTARGGGDGA